MARDVQIQSRFTPSVGGVVDARRAIDEMYQNVTALAGRIPTGAILPMIIPEGDDTVPGWLPLDGREWPQYEYPALFKLIRYSNGTPTSTDLFKLPDWRSKVLVGYSSDPEADARVGSGGSITYTAGAVSLPIAHVGYYIKT